MTNKRKWEMFSDVSYYDMWCVRLVGDNNFNSTTSFHFMKYEDASTFFELLKVAY